MGIHADKHEEAIMAGALKVVYISGAYEDKRGEWYVEKNIRAAELAASQVWRLGGGCVMSAQEHEVV